MPPPVNSQWRQACGENGQDESLTKVKDYLTSPGLIRRKIADRRWRHDVVHPDYGKTRPRRRRCQDAGAVATTGQERWSRRKSGSSSTLSCANYKKILDTVEAPDQCRIPTDIRS